MATQPKSKAVEEYRRQIALYLETVRIRKGWKLVRMGEEAGGLKHTTISRALKRENTLSFPALLALEDASGVPIPPNLVTCARIAQQPVRVDEAADLQRQIEEVARGLAEPDRKALLKSLRVALSRGG